MQTWYVKIWFPEWKENQILTKETAFRKIAVFCLNIFNENNKVSNNAVHERL